MGEYELKKAGISNFDIVFPKSIDASLDPHYVKSWRWLPLDDSTVSELTKHNKIIQSTIDGKTSTAIISDSEHFASTLIVTLFSGSEKSSLEIILFLQNYAVQNKSNRIQILTKEKLPDLELLEHKLSFHLLKKNLG